MQEDQRELSTEQQRVYLAIWEKAVDTQMHFNEMSVKARQFGLTFVAAALGLGVVTLTRGPDPVIPIYSLFEIHGIVMLTAASAVAMYAVSLLDLKVYHRMLRGAVTFGEDFEENYMKQIFQLEKGMTQAISHYSRHDDADVDKSVPRYRYIGKSPKNAEIKIKRFYTVSTWTLAGLAVFLFLMTANFGGRHAGTAADVAVTAPAAGAPQGDKGRTDAR